MNTFFNYLKRKFILLTLLFLLVTNLFSATFTIHYQRNDNNYENKGIWFWGDVKNAPKKWPIEAINFVRKDDFGVVYEITINDNAKKIGFLVVDKTIGDKGKDGGDKTFTSFDKSNEVYIFQGDNIVYLSKDKKTDENSTHIAETNEHIKEFSNEKIDFKSDFDSLSWRNNEYNNLRIYQIMVGSFQDSDTKGFKDGYGPSNYKGDINGITNSLDYIKSLNINAIWLTPIFVSHSVDDKLQHTGYFADDYFNVDPRFGTNDDFKKLVTEAHARGIYVFLDGVFGHHGATPIEGVVDGNTQAGGYEIKYPESIDWAKKVAQYWIENYEIDGWRFDQAYQMVQNNHNYLYDIRKAIEEISFKREKEGKKWGILGYSVGEIWDGSGIDIKNKGFKDKGLYSFFDFPQRYTLVQTFAIQENINEPWAKQNDVTKINETFNISKNYPVNSKMNLIITNHDLVRFGNLLERGNITKYDSTDYWNRHKLILSFLGAYTGPVTIYYGDEYGAFVNGYKISGDLNSADDNMSRDNGRIKEFSDNEKDLIHFTSKIMDIRSKNKVLYSGERINIKALSNIYIDKKYDSENTIYFALNLNKKEKEIKIDSSYKLVDLISGQEFEKNSKIIIPAMQSMYLKEIK